MRLLLLACYPLGVHLWVITQQPVWQLLAMVCLAAGIQYSGLRQGSLLAWGALLLIALASVWLVVNKMAQYAFYLPPVVLPLLASIVFLRTLIPGEVPLVTAIGRQVHGQLPLELERYTRRVTVFWPLLLALMALVAALLPLSGSFLAWSWFSNFLSYALVAAAFLGEYFYRRWRFRHFPQPSFRAYLAIVFNSESSFGRRF